MKNLRALFALAFSLFVISGASFAGTTSSQPVTVQKTLTFETAGNAPMGKAADSVIPAKPVLTASTDAIKPIRQKNAIDISLNIAPWLLVAFLVVAIISGSAYFFESRRQRDLLPNAPPPSRSGNTTLNRGTWWITSLGFMRRRESW